MSEQHPLHGIMAEFETAAALIHATKEAHKAGYRKMDAYTPYPIEGVYHAMSAAHSKLPWLIFLGGLFGAAVGFGFQFWVSTMAYRLNIGGRPLNTWPAFIPVTFEVTILIAGCTTVFGMLALCGFPQPYHPVFNVARFAKASQDGFFLCLESTDPLFDTEKTTAFLQTLHPTHVDEVPR
jgi:hypothetical protein